MKCGNAHLSYCTNIHPGVDWESHFSALKSYFPRIKAALSPKAPMGLGLRVSEAACAALGSPATRQRFRQWLKQQQAYVFTMNGFPYGDFHSHPVKDKVHSPDWLSPQRVNYTRDLFRLLSDLLPEGMEGSISTSPLSYKPWYSGAEEIRQASLSATRNILEIVEFLHEHENATGQYMHLDLEPEPDGLIESGPEFLQWYDTQLLPMGTAYFSRAGMSVETAARIIKRYLGICYDICHFALGYENHAHMLKELASRDIPVGKLQISAALKAGMPGDPEGRQGRLQAFSEFNEPIYLHQVIARKPEGMLKRYRDIPQALAEDSRESEQWRAHFHVPLFLQEFGLLESTQDEVIQVLDLFKKQPFTRHLEVETYTWGVLPESLKRPLDESIIRELQWSKEQLENQSGRHEESNGSY